MEVKELTEKERRRIEDIIESIMYLSIGIAICTVVFLPVWMIVLLCG